MQLNPNAAKNFNQRAETLLNQLQAEPIKPKQVVKRKSFILDFHISATLEPIGEIKISRTNPLGKEIGKEFNHEGNKITIYGEQYQQLKQIAQSIQKHRISVTLLVRNSLLI